MFYFVIDLRNRKKDVRKFISVIENSIIETLREFNIECHADRGKYHQYLCLFFHIN